MDWNSDGYHDLLVGDSDGNVVVFLNTNNNINPIMDSGTTIMNIGDIKAKPVMDDWNGDGKKDLLVGNYTGTIQVYLNEGADESPLFNSSTLLQVGGADFNVRSIGSIEGRSGLRIYDWNQDGLKDILVSSYDGYVYYLENVGTNAAPLFDSAEKFLTGSGDPLKFDYLNTPAGRTNTHIFVTDWNEDGLADIVMGGIDGKLELFLTSSLITNVIPENSGSISVTDSTDGSKKFLVANPGAGFSFNRWTGCDPGTGSSSDDCVVTMDRLKTVTAEFIHALDHGDTSISFGKVNIGINAERTITLKNNGMTQLEIGAITVPSFPFSIDKSDCDGNTYAPSDTCEITVGFAPDSTGTFYDTFEIEGVKVALTGTGASTEGNAQDISVSTFSINDFLNTALNSTRDNDLSLIVTNEGNAGLTIHSITITGTDSDKFMLVPNPGNCDADQTLGPSGNCTVDVRLRAQSQAGGPFIANITIISSDPDEDTVHVGLTGSAIANGNNPPMQPELTSPANGVASSRILFTWKDALDDTGDTVTHKVYYSTDPGFVSPVMLGAIVQENNTHLAGLYTGSTGIVSLFGMIAAGGLLTRKKTRLLIATMLLVAGLILVSCGSDVGNDEGTVVRTTQETVYYWKVVASDCNGGITESDTYLFRLIQ